jgi:hypothetical protein
MRWPGTSHVSCWETAVALVEDREEKAPQPPKEGVVPHWNHQWAWAPPVSSEALIVALVGCSSVAASVTRMLMTGVGADVSHVGPTGSLAVTATSSECPRSAEAIV